MFSIINPRKTELYVIRNLLIVRYLAEIGNNNAAANVKYSECISEVTNDMDRRRKKRNVK
jgi:cell division protein FtsB